MKVGQIKDYNKSHPFIQRLLAAEVICPEHSLGPLLNDFAWMLVRMDKGNYAMCWRKDMPEYVHVERVSRCEVRAFKVATSITFAGM